MMKALIKQTKSTKKIKLATIPLTVAYGILLTGCVPLQSETRVYQDQTCYNKARIAVLNMPPSSYKSSLGPIARTIDEDELLNRVYDDCIRLKGLQVQTKKT
jgi:hypothetical protein